MNRHILIAAIAAMPLSAMAITPLWLRDAKISPDGKEIAFTYKGDIWKVASSGGQATRLTSGEYYDTTPIWSPDSKYIAFASDRHGNDDIFILSANGGLPTRLTFNSATETPESFSPDGKYIYFSAAIQDPAKSALFPATKMSELYKVPVKGGAATQVIGTPAKMIDFVPGSSDKLLYQDVKGRENEWRKHQNASATSDIWCYDLTTRKHTNLTSRQGEDRNPAATADGFYFLSERNGGSMNVYYAPLADPSQAKALTSFKEHPVRFLSLSDNGTLCYTYDGEIYTQQPTGKPSKVKIELTDDYVENPYKMAVPRPSEVAVSPDGKSIAFISRGEVFVTSVEYKTTKQLTHTPEAERWVEWGDSSKSVIYASERDGIYNIYEAKMGRKEDPNFPNATIIEETALFKPDGHERTVPQISPDGKKLAFILDRNILAVKDLESGKVKKLTDGTTYKQRDGGFDYKWSPDSKWIALEVSNRDPYTDVAIINVEDGSLTNITRSGYFDYNPEWVLDGNALLYKSEKYGMRNHASWGSMYDVMIVFLNQKAYDNYLLSKEDAELAEEEEKLAAASKKDDKKDDKKNGKKADKKDDGEEDDDKSINVELDGIEDRIVRLTPFSSELYGSMITPDGDKLLFITDGGDNNMLWELDLRSDDLDMVKTISPGLTTFATSRNGKKSFLLGRSMQQFNTSSYKLTPITYSATMTVDPAAEREFMFDNIAREEKQRFYDVNMHGVDWDKLTAHYRKFLPYINNNEDYTEMLSELLGELNVSHTGARNRSASTTNADRTASLGLLYDMSYNGDGLLVDEVVEKGPFDKAASKVHPGVIVKAINGEKITPANDYTLLLTDLSGKKTLVSFTDPATGESWDEVVKPISSSYMSDLLYNRWVQARAADVDRWSNGRLGYVHIESMGDDSFREMYSDALGKYSDRDGLVVDIRWNGGGRLHEDVEVFLSGEKYLTQVIRGNKSCDMPSRRWNKPSIMLMDEACYSNAHGTPWVYRNRGIGKLVGMPVPGTMTSVNWVTMQDPDMYYGIPVIGYLTAEGNYLENTQLEPDIKIANDPATVVTGEDQQLRKAVEELLKDLDK